MNLNSTTQQFTVPVLEQLFTPLAQNPGSIWLDSSLNIKDRGRYSLIARNPSQDIMLENDQVIVRSGDQKLQVSSKEDFFPYMESIWKDDTKFTVGYITYEATLLFLGLTGGSNRQGIGKIADIRFLVFDSVLYYDNIKHTVEITNPDFDDYSDILRKEYYPDNISPVYQKSNVRSILTRDEYLERIRKVKYHIHEGDIYQANFTTGFEVISEKDSFETYRSLRYLNPAPYSAYMNFGDYQILSSSPERMILKNGNRVITSPIKGTISRGDNNLEEKINLDRLLHSEKDKAELLMIVDLERNDLGRVSSFGSVKVEKLNTPTVYSSLIHLDSDVSATLRPDVTLSELLKAILPGGSISGAPKKRAVEILSELETIPRGIYTGCIGYVYGDTAEFNIAIRTMLHQDNHYLVHAGGGIVADSVPEAEYDEMLLKAGNIFRAVGISDIESDT